MPEDIYGGYEYSYPPFFHILNAIVMAIAGFPALKYSNLTLLFVFMGSFFFLLRRHYGNDVAMIACLLISLSPTLAENTVRFMTELLSMALVFASFYSLLLALKTKNSFYAIVAGVATGLLMLSKQIGIVILGFYGFLLFWFFYKHRQDVKLQLYVILTAIAVFSPYLIWAVLNRVEIFGFVSLFLGKKPEWATKAVTSFRMHDSALKEFVSLFYSGNGVILCAMFLLPLYHFVRTRKQDFPHNSIFLMTLYLAAIMIAWHITNSRHTITLLPLLTFLAGYSLQQHIPSRTALRVVLVLLLLVASFTAYNMPNYRQARNPPPEALKMVSLIQEKKHQSQKRTLVIQAFDYLMYTGKPTIWPFPNLETNPLDLFDDLTPYELYNLLKHYDIDLVLIDTRFVIKTDDFMGRNYPLLFLRNCELLEKLGKLQLLALSKSSSLILLEVI